MASASDCIANTCTGGGGGGGSGGATSAARAAASFSSILPLAMARSLRVGITSTPVTSSAGAPSNSIGAVVSSSRLSWPCRPTISTSKRSAPVRTGQAAPQVLGHQLRVLGRDQVGQLAIDEVDAVDADETGELAVGVQDHFAMHEHRFVDALAELGEQLRAGLLAARSARGARQQLVDRHAERLQIELFLLDVDALRQPFRAERALHRE